MSTILRVTCGLLAVVRSVIVVLVIPLAMAPSRCHAAPVQESEAWISPCALTVSPDGGVLFVASATSGQVLVLDTATREVQRTFPMPAEPSGVALSPDGSLLLVTCAAPESTLEILEWRTGKWLRSVRLGSGATAPVVSPDGARVYVCNRFNDSVSVISVEKGEEICRVPVQREPVAAALTPDGGRLLVANHLPIGRADLGEIAARVTVIDTASCQVAQQLPLLNGGNLVRDVRVSPDGRHACVTHVLARFQLPTTQVERGWMNGNAITLIDLTRMTVLNTVLLDQVERGAANPWGVGWSADGRHLVVAHAGTHELSVIDYPGLLRRLEGLAREPQGRAPSPGYVVSQAQADVPSDLSFLVGLRQVVALGGNGPRAVVLQGATVFVGNYFSENISVVDLTRQALRSVDVPLGPRRPMNARRRGEALFNDATICLESWQSCASCHSSDGRVDALNWDLMNDGKGNPKNTKSLLHAHKTPPAMSLGVRATAEVAVRAGIHHILFTHQPEDVPCAIDEWLAGLEAYPSPHLEKGQLSAAAQRGKVLFMDETTGCAACHVPPLYTNLGSYPVGTLATGDPARNAVDTPTLIELWRTAPYLHDGSAATLREVLVERNVRDQHGKTSHLSGQELDDLIAYLLSL